MKKTLALVMLVLVQVILPSCAHMQPMKFDPSQLAMAYYTQEQDTESLELTGVQSITLSAAPGQSINLILRNQLEPLSVYPRDPTAIQQLGEALFKIGGVVGATMVGTDLVSAVANPPAAQVVHPLVVGR